MLINKVKTMYSNNSNLDDITLRYADTSSKDDLRTSFHTRKDVFSGVDLGDVLDFILPDADVIDIDTLPHGEYNVVVEFDSADDMMHFIRMFAPIELSLREAHLKEYKKQKKNSPFH